ncbi:hypothetical protein KAU33_03805 [Candidatus Dependentiae bacterium]|nr:hypothetical protein [Candidatus Dependentiae bacterium]
MKYVCNRCGEITPELSKKPEKCPTCGVAQDELTLINGEIIPTIEPTPEQPKEPTTFGIQSNPSEIRRLLKLIVIPDGDTAYNGFQKTNLRLVDDKLLNFQVAPAEAILTILDLDRDYFKETWKNGEIVLNSTESLKKLKVLNAYDSVSIQVDNENKVILHQAGDSAGFSDNLEDASHVITSKAEMPVPFEYDTFKPKIDEDSPESEYKWHVTVDASSFASLFEVTKNTGTEFFPFSLKGNEFSTGVGDMKNPGMEGAFFVNIPIIPEESILPDAEIKVEVGPIFENVMKNISGKVEIYFAGDELPLWILYRINKSVVEDDKTVEKTFGRMGYVIPPRSA